MTRARHALVACVFASATASCALVSGLSSLDVDETSDASLPDVIGGDVAPQADVAVDSRADASGIDVTPPPLDGGVDVAIDAAKDAAPDVASIQCGASTCPLTSVCCHRPFNQSFTCYADASACTGNGYYPVTCDVRSCTNNQVCCITVQQVIGLGASCSTTCSLPNTRLCLQDGAACPVGLTCAPSVSTFPPYDICK